jgi:hypothetical protein
MPNPLFEAIGRRNADKVLELVSKWFFKPDVNEISSEGPWQGWTPLMAAAYVLSVPSLRHLAEAGAQKSINKVCAYDGITYKGLTALHIACKDYVGQDAFIKGNYSDNLHSLQHRAYCIQQITSISGIKTDYICTEGKYKGFAPLHLLLLPDDEKNVSDINDHLYLQVLNITFRALAKSINQFCKAETWLGCAPLHMISLLTKTISYPLSVTSALIENGANVNLPCSEGQWKGCTPLHLASLAWQVTDYTSDIDYGKSIISLLIEKGAEVNFICHSKGKWEGFTPLMMAICKSEMNTTTFAENKAQTFLEVRLAIISLLIEKDANVNLICNKGTWKGYSPLAMAAVLEDKEISEILIEKEAEVDAAITFLQEKNKPNAVKLLLTLRIQIKIKNANIKKDGNTKLHIACEKVYSQVNCSIIHKLLNPSEESESHHSSDDEDESNPDNIYNPPPLKVTPLPEDVNKLNRRFETALMVALRANGDPDETSDITNLLGPQTNLDTVDKHHGRTAFMWTCLNKTLTGSFDFFNDRCTAFEIHDKEGNTVFLLSVIGDAPYYIEKLIQKQVNVSSLNKLDEDALMLAGKGENNSVGPMLIANGVPINRISKKTNKSALNLAIENKNINLCFALIASRLLFCIASGILSIPSVKILDLLFEQGGHINQRDHLGQTLFHVMSNESFLEYAFQLEGADSLESSALDFSGRNVETALKENKKVEYNFKDISNNLSTLTTLANEKKKNPIWQKLLPLCQEVISAPKLVKNVIIEESSNVIDINIKQKTTQSRSRKSNKSAFFSEPEEAPEIKRKTTETSPIKEDIPVKKKHRL